MPNLTNPPADHTRAAWRWCLATAFRTGLACTIVGCLTLYGPSFLHQQIAFPAFSYVTVILIVTDATFGDTLHGCWLALYATFQSLGPAMLSLWLIGPARFTSGTISLAVALGAFVVALPEGTHLIAKRIALGQIVIVYVIAFINGVHTQPIMHPLHVAASTAVGVLACMLALLLPYPRLACWEVKENCKLLAENASKRLKLYVKAFAAEDGALALSSISQAKLLASAGTKLLQNIKRYQGSMKWERLPFKFLRHYYMNPGEKLQELEIPLKGMEMALTGISSFPVKMAEGETKESLQLEEHVSLTLKQIKNCLPCDSLTVPESKAETIIESLQTLQIIPKATQDLSSLFFLFCMKLLHCKPLPKQTSSKQESEGSTTSSKKNSFLDSIWTNWAMNVRSKRLMPAFKCSLSLGLAILFGLLYSKENGFWSGLPVAISLAASREATFKVANVKAQGTVLGTVYGVLGCFVFERFMPIRFLSLLPWFILTSFLRRSRMYGQAGGISAAIGAVLILGRKGFGPPSEFAIARITETFIGLSCSIMVELILQPTRAASLAKVQLTKSLGSLSACIGSISLEANLLVENQRRLKLEVSELKKFIGEAEVEPNFWFLPFHSACYGKLFGSLSKMVDLLLFSAHAVGFLQQESQKYGASWKEFVNKLDGDLELFKEMVGSLIKCLEDVTLLKSLTFLDKELENRKLSYDPELGNKPNSNIFRISGPNEEDEIGSIMHSYLQHSKEVVDKLHAVEDKEQKSQMVLNLGALGFCMNNFIKEARELQKGIQELVQWENPGKDVNLLEISCKIAALYS
ncbi:conserved hypothetical protein [Ricinus communis]|uniref:Integral membrane bound transporter domain-containing protein n=1 Tax=Ricinus communis TaxID=3988 RepID=B9SZF1_RICCO|nr:conserved hypothetical protein [Ricinus communis]|eukprot:XP_002531370.1 uncharacterized protein LOC8281884 [Ricinus communis]